MYRNLSNYLLTKYYYFMRCNYYEYLFNNSCSYCQYNSNSNSVSIYKKLEKKQILLFIAISFAIMYILISIVYWFSGFGIEKNIHEASKNFVLYIFVPVNVILTIPYFASQYMKLKENVIKKNNFANKITIIGIILLTVLVAEFFYFKKIQKKITSINEVTQNNIELNNDNKEKTTTDGYNIYNGESNSILENDVIVTLENTMLENYIITNTTD